MTHQTAVTIEIPSNPVHRNASEIDRSNQRKVDRVRLTGDTISGRGENRHGDGRNVLVGEEKKSTTDSQTSEDVRGISLQFHLEILPVCSACS